MADFAAFLTDLRSQLRGEVSADPVTLGVYATDASIYQQIPGAVALPLDAEDTIAAVRCAAAHNVAIVPRGGGTGLAGQAIGEGVLIVDVSKHMNQVLEVNVEERWARVQPGVVRDEFNALVAQHGLHFAPDPATGNRANFGGMIANNSSGTRSIRYGKTIDHVIGLTVVLSDGTVLELGELDPDEYRERAAAETREGHILSRFREIINAEREEILERYPKILRRCAGYMLDEFVHTDRWNVAKLISGSEGTLATILECRVNLTPLPQATCLVVAHFEDLLDSIRHVESILDYQPSAVEILDGTVVDLARNNLLTAPLCGFIEGDPQAILVIEFAGDTPEQVTQQAQQMIADMSGHGIGYAWPLLTDKQTQADVWLVRKSGLGLMGKIRGDAKAQAFIEDAAVPVRVLPDYIGQVLDICRQHDTAVTMYAHASVGLIHVRPILSLKQADDIEKMKAIQEACFELVRGYGGSFSGEHGDGMVRAHFLERFYGPRIYEAFRQVKALFDPQGLMNPGKIVDAPPMDANLRYGTTYQVADRPAYFHFHDEGGFAAAVETCNGVGACRKTGGTMCPSYMATRDEEHSTRGRANALRLAMTGQLGPQGLGDEGVYGVLDLCLSCKGCKSECPSNVDMARLKSEFLQHYHDQRGLPLRDKLVARSPDLAARLSGSAARLVNKVQGSSLMRGLLNRLVGLDARRTPPAYATQTFGDWFRQRAPQVTDLSRRVVLFDDTWLRFHEPRVGISAVELLESCGYEVLVANAGCCQRPRISHGLLREAKELGGRTLRNLDPWLEDGVPVVCCEPSCCSALNDDLPDLIDDPDLAARARTGIRMIDVFLADEVAAGRLSGPFESTCGTVRIHGHCHQKTLYGTAAMKTLLGLVEGLDFAELETGCCGMAGSFGYEAEHYELSVKVAEDRLLPAVRELSPEVAVIACGFSCRHQLADLADREARHFVEVIRRKVT